MALDIDQLFTPIDENEALEQVLDVFTALGFSARSWQDGSIPRTIVEYLAKFLADKSLNVNSMARGAFNQYATGVMLTLFSLSQYNNVRDAGLRTIGDVTMTTASGSGPYSKAIGTVVVRDTKHGIRYRNTTAITLTDTAPVLVEFEAELLGDDGNQAGEDDVDELVTALAGVTLSNIALWITTNGADPESDAELRVRNTNKWATLSTSGPKGVYKVWALDADEAVTRVGVDDTNAAGAGTIGIYLADDDGAAPGGTVATVQAYIDNERPLGATPVVALAPELTVTVTYAATYDSTAYTTDGDAKTAIEAAVLAFFTASDVAESSSATLPLGGLYQAANAVSGIVNCTFSAPIIDTPMVAGQVAVTVVDASLTGTATAV